MEGKDKTIASPSTAKHRGLCNYYMDGFFLALQNQDQQNWRRQAFGEKGLKKG